MEYVQENESKCILLNATPWRPTIELSEKRNKFVVNLADRILFAYAHPGGKTESLARNAIIGGKTVYTLDCPDNVNLTNMGAVPVRPNNISKLFEG
jgi:hypothetical protein